MTLIPEANTKINEATLSGSRVDQDLNGLEYQ